MGIELIIVVDPSMMFLNKQFIFLLPGGKKAALLPPDCLCL